MAEKTENLGNCSLKGAEKLRHILLEMEENGGRMRPFSGSEAYPCLIRAVYRGRVHIGFEDKNNETV
jgi:hypothetical protein